VKRLLINTETGKISEVIIGSGGAFDIGDDLVAVPWHAIDAAKSGEDLALRVPRDALQKAPRVDENDFASLTEPLTITTIYDYYAPLVVADTNGQSKDETNGQSKDEGGQMNDRLDKQSRSSAQKSSSPSSNKQMADNSSASSDQSQEPIAHLLVGRDVITVLAPPALLSANEIKGTDVRTRDGDEIGEIDQIMIDLQRGQVAYLLIEDGGFLGIGDERLPVPMASLDWSPGDDAGFVVDASGAELKKMTSLTGYDEPAKVKGAQLAQLYQRFDVQPYWADSSQTASTNE
jgi:sporulation protein YlmC with PRC-barrel domain